MNALNYTTSDGLRTLVALLLYLPFAVFPGYTLARAANALGFRGKQLGEKLLIAVPLSIGTVPLLIYLTEWLAAKVTGRSGPMRFVWAIIAANTLLFCAQFIGDLRTSKSQTSSIQTWTRPAVVGLIWVALAMLVMLDLPWNDRLYMSVPSWDYSVRSPIIHSITQTGATPANPLFYPGEPVPLRYHYFFFLACSLVESISGGWVGPTQALLAASIWNGFGLMALMVLFTANRAKRAWAGIAMLCVIGLDIFPYLLLQLGKTSLMTIDKWNEDVVGWVDSLLWAPHYVAGVIGCLMAFLILWKAPAKTNASKPQWGVTILAGIAFASAAGTAIYVTVVFAAAMSVLVLMCLWKRWWREFNSIVMAGAIAVLLALPYLLTLVHGSKSVRGGSVLVPTVRTFLVLQIALQQSGLSGWVVALGNLLVLPLNYGMELGALFLVGIVQFRRYAKRRVLSKDQWAGVVLLLAPLFMCTFFRSSVITNNDLGWRGFLIPQFILSLWAADYCMVAFRKSKAHSPALQTLRSRLRVLIYIGLAGTLAGLTIDRGYLPAKDAGWNRMKNWLIPDRSVGRRNLALRQAYEWVSQHTPEDAVVLVDPQTPDLPFGIYGKRQSLLYTVGCGVEFGGAIAQCDHLLTQTQPLFAKTSTNVKTLDVVCANYHLGAVVIKDVDEIWRDSKSWVWQRQPAYANSFSRVYTCGPQAPTLLIQTSRK